MAQGDTEQQYGRRLAKAFTAALDDAMMRAKAYHRYCPDDLVKGTIQHFIEQAPMLKRMVVNTEMDNSQTRWPRRLRPRLNQPFLHVFLCDCLSKLACIEVTHDDINNMD